MEARRDAVVIDGVARNKALKVYKALSEKGELPRQAFDRALRDYLAATTLTDGRVDTRRKVRAARAGETPVRYAERLGIPVERQPRAIYVIDDALFYYGLPLDHQDAWNAYVVREALAFNETKADAREYVQCHHNWCPSLGVRDWAAGR